MKTLTGKPVSPGYAHGRAVLLGAHQVDIPKSRIRPEQVETELERFHAALENTRREMQHLQARVHAELGSAAAEIFSAHLLFLRDQQFIDKVETSIRRDRLSLEAAIAQTTDELAQLLSNADNAYLRERAADIRDLRTRLMLQIATTGGERLRQLAPDSILIARELLPSDLLEFNRDCLAGIVTEIGGETGHAAILARALGVPAVTGVSNAMQVIQPSTVVVVDGQTGEVVLDPEAHALDASMASKQQYDSVTRNAVEAEARECITRDGVRIQLLANIGLPFEVHQVAEHHLDGIGLFRTEYLFLDEPVAPSFERQQETYQQIAAALDGLPLVIRTLDLGADKWPAFLKPKFEANPNLGVRGLRFSLLADDALFRTQIRAALHAAGSHEVQIMLPMVLGGSDMLQAINLIRQVAEEDGIVTLPPIGALVETPSAVFAIDEILAIADFISIGTNDLTQFMLAADRNALALIDDYTVLHPSVLRAVHQVIEAAHAAGKPAAVCGEAASDPRVACLLVGLGARKLSMNPVSTARVRYALRASELSALEALAHAALNSDSARTVSELVTEALRTTYPDFGTGTITV